MSRAGCRARASRGRTESLRARVKIGLDQAGSLTLFQINRKISRIHVPHSQINSAIEIYSIFGYLYSFNHNEIR